jgi:metacaspase-1
MKIGLLIGINYIGTSAELNGCINDINNVEKLLKTTLKYDEIIRLSDTDGLKPTGNNIINALYRIVMKTRKMKVNELWIHYSGHGTYVRDTNNDEVDKYDEAIVPLDYDKFGVISDDVIHYFLKHINPKTNVFTLFDSCHSGTVVDLPYNYIYSNNSLRQQLNFKKKINTRAVLFSGSMDHQTAADAYNVNNDKKYSGAMTSLFLKVINDNKYNLNYFDLLKKLSSLLKSKGFSQIPQLSKNHGVNSKLKFISNSNNKITLHY